MMRFTRSTGVRSEWPSLPAPGIRTKIPHSLFRAASAAMRAVDLDIERVGTVTVETVEQVRTVRALLRAI